MNATNAQFSLRKIGTGLAALGGLLLALCATTHPVGAQTTSGGSLMATPEIGIDQRLDEQVPLDIPFRDETGKGVTIGDYLGKKPVILIMPFYKCAGACTLELNGLAEAAKNLSYKMGDDYQIVTVSINPTEGPDIAAAKKAAYVAMSGRPESAQGWHFLTGQQDNILRLAKSVGFRYMINLNANPVQIQHAAGLMILTPGGKVSRYFFGTEFRPNDLRFALQEASGNKIGNITDQLLVKCYMYDPSSGHYSLAVVRLLQVTGCATALGLALFIGLLLRWERRHPRTLAQTDTQLAEVK